VHVILDKQPVRQSDDPEQEHSGAASTAFALLLFARPEEAVSHPASALAAPAWPRRVRRRGLGFGGAAGIAGAGLVAGGGRGGAEGPSHLLHHTGPAALGDTGPSSVGSKTSGTSPNRTVAPVPVEPPP